MCRKESEIFIRNIDKKDLDVLYVIDQKCFTPEIAYDRTFFKQLLSHSSMTGFMLEIKTGTAGTGTSRANSTDPAGFILAVRHRNLAEIVTIDILKPYRRRGFGQILMQKAEENLSSYNVTQVCLHVSVGNKPAINLYQKLDYFVLCEEKNYYQNNEDAYTMFKLL